MANHRKGPSSAPPSWSDADSSSRKQLFDKWRHNGPPLTFEQQRERQAYRARTTPAFVDDAALETFAAAASEAAHRSGGAGSVTKTADDLAEAQLGLLARCTICGKPVTGRDVPRDRSGRPRHHRCPP